MYVRIYVCMPPVGQSNDDVGVPATPGTERTSEPKASPPPPQSGMSGAQIDLTDTKAVTEALHTHTHITLLARRNTRAHTGTAIKKKKAKD